MKRAMLAIVTVLIGVVVVAGSVVALSARTGRAGGAGSHGGRHRADPAGHVAARDVGTVDPPTTPRLSTRVPPGSPTRSWRRTGSSSPRAGRSTGRRPPLQLPAHTLVTVTLKQYNRSATPWNPVWAQVHGTVDGTATYNGKPLSEITSANLAHTFTIHQYSQSGQDNRGSSSACRCLRCRTTRRTRPTATRPRRWSSSPSSLPGPGEYVWNCEDPAVMRYQNFGGVMQARGWDEWNDRGGLMSTVDDRPIADSRRARGADKPARAAPDRFREWGSRAATCAGSRSSPSS